MLSEGWARGYPTVAVGKGPRVCGRGNGYAALTKTYKPKCPSHLHQIADLT